MADGRRVQSKRDGTANWWQAANTSGYTADWMGPGESTKLARHPFLGFALRSRAHHTSGLTRAGAWRSNTWHGERVSYWQRRWAK